MGGIGREWWSCTAPECDKKFEQYRSQVTNPDRPFCSKPCALRFNSLQKFPLDARHEAAQRYEAGEHTGLLSVAYGVSSQTMRNALKELGVSLDRARSGAATWSRRTGVPPDEGDLETGFRWCKACRQRKPMSEYYWITGRNATRSRLRRCKPCAYKAIKGGANLRVNRRKYLYGLSDQEFRRMWAEQGGGCAICSSPLVDDSKGVHVDHCHSSGKVRGLLCSGCNTGLGHFRDSSSFLRSAADYLDRNPDTR